MMHNHREGQRSTEAEAKLEAEIEVLFLLAKGRNRAYIREELVIGDETVKSHIKSIYRKADVHSQQELIDLLERESSAGEPRGRG